jgi:ABC-type nitrate/sulfonate/bicarbonate transport system substrate-binding protein
VLNKKNIIVVALILALLALFVLFGLPKKDGKAIKYAYIPSALIDAPSVAATELFKAKNIEPVPFVTGRETIQALTGGATFAATLAEWPFLLASNNRDDLRVIAVITSAESMGILADRKSGINSIADLEGKRIGFPQGTSAQFMFETYVDKAGLLDKVSPINLAPPLLQPSINRGDIDAMAIWQPFLEKARLERPDDLFYLSGSQSAFRVVYCVVTTAENIEKNPEGVRNILEALIAAETKLNSADPQVIKSLVETTGLDTDTLDTLLPLFRFKVVLDDEIIDTWQVLAPWALKKGLAPEEVLTRDWRKFIHTETLRDIDPNRVQFSEQ